MSDGHLRALGARGLGLRKLNRLVSLLGTLERVGDATAEALRDVGLDRNQAQRHAHALSRVDLPAMRQEIGDRGIGLVTVDEKCYPPLLRLIPDPPVALWGKGTFEALHPPTLAVVGSRRCSVEAGRAAWRFATQLASWGLTLVSGGARGIDAWAHRAALAMGGRTVVILGCGHAHCYPAEHAELFAEVCEAGGAVVSEFLPQTGPRPGHFPRRNRIISGLSLGVLVIEAGPRSGALITARLAAEEHGREVLALPSSLETPEGMGSLSLLARGEAQMALSPQDVVSQLRFSSTLLEAAQEQLDQKNLALDQGGLSTYEVRQ